MKKLISIVIPAFNEEKNIDLLYKTLSDQIKKSEDKYAFEVIIIEDGSKDKTGEEIEKVVAKDKRFHMIELSRNFGKEIAVTAGIHEAKGDACIILDADLQFPIELLPEFLEKWEAGADVVVGVRKENKDGKGLKGLIKKYGSRLYYKIMDKIAHTKVMHNATDFRLFDRLVIDAFDRFTERDRITRGLIDWMGFKRDYIYFTANDRLYGEASYDLIKKFKLAISSFIGLSLFPLKLAGYIGVFITFVSGVFGLVVLFGKFVFLVPFFMSFSGTALLAIMMLFLIGVVLACLGLIALYVATIYGEVLNRPLYVVRRKK